MILPHLFFHIHTCNGRSGKAPAAYSRHISRTLQHHMLALVTEGKGVLQVGDHRHPAKVGMLFYIAPGVPHILERDHEDPALFLTVHFSYARVSLQEGKWDISDETPALSLQPVQVVKEYYPVEDTFGKLIDCWNTKLPGYEFMAKTLLQQLIITLYQDERKQTPNFAASQKVEKMIHFMHQNSQQKITLKELSGQVDLSPAYLSRMFKETTGYSPIEYFNKIKMDKAKELLIEGNRKVKEVAQALGYSDEFYFSRLFKRMEGISPSEYSSKKVHGL